MTSDNDKKAAEEYYNEDRIKNFVVKEDALHAFLAGCEHKQKELDKATELLSLVHVCLMEGRYETLMKAFNIPTPLKPIKHSWFSEKESEEIRETLKKEQES